MSFADVRDLLFTEDNEDKFAAHGVSPEQLLQVLRRPHAIKRNRKARAGTFLIVGLDDQGQCIAFPITATDEIGLWRPVTAWYCKSHEWGWLP